MRTPRPPAADVRIAAALGALVAVESAVVVDHDIPVAVAVLASLSIAAPLAWRRVAPATAAGVIAVALFVETAVFDAALVAGTLAILVAVLSIFSLALYAEPRPFVAAAAVALLAYNGLAFAGPETDLEDVLFVDAVVLAPSFAAGRLARSRREVAARLADVAAQLEAERGARAATAAAAERTRLAAELHGVIAGGVAAMVREADAARELAAARPRDATERIATVETIGRDTLDELRRALGVLRREDDDLALAPQPTLARLDALAQRSRRDGLDVAVDVTGRPVAVSAGFDIAAYRLVEDALHASEDATHADVEVVWSARHLGLDVTTDGRPPDDRALTALRERAALFGGELLAGRRRERGSRIRVELPLEVAGA